MKTRLLMALALTMILTLGIVAIVGAVSGAAFTTFNPWVDGLFREVCKNSLINCNIYGSKPDVWLNGGPAANGLGPDGQYFFAVLVPGGQPDPNDGGAKNLSDDYDRYTDRTFTVTGGEVSSYGGPHDQDSGNFLDPDRKYCTAKRGCAPDGQPPLIRLYPYADTWNPGGVYILAICYIGDGSQYPVEPRDCKYDAFKVKQNYTASLMLSGIKFEDMFADAKVDWVYGVYEDPGLPDWSITIKGTGFLGESIDETVKTNADGFWSYQKDYSYNKFTPLVPAKLTVCEVLQPGWVQSYPDPKCYNLTLEPAALAEVPDLDFGNWYPGEKSGMKFEDLDANGVKDAGDPGLAGWTIYVDYNGNAVHDAGEPSAVTGVDGAYTITGIKPGLFKIYEVQKTGWTCSFPAPCYYEHPFYSRAVYAGNDFGNWYPATKGGYKWYDRNGNGAWDAGEPPIAGWPVKVYAGDLLVDSMVTNANGYYEFTLKPGAYTVKEVCPSANWYQTWPVPSDGCGSGVYTVMLISRQVEKDNNFGNYCVGRAEFGTKGFWHNKNGLAIITQADIDYVNGLPPYSAATFYWAFPFDGLWAAGTDTYFGEGAWAEISDFLPDRVNTAPAQMQLSQQLLAFIFNARHWLDSPAAVIWTGSEWVSAQNIIDSAILAWGTPGIDDDHYWAGILDGMNNNKAVLFIHDAPCEFVCP